MLGTSARPETVPGSLDLQREPAGFLSGASRFWPLGLVALAALVVVGGWYAAQVIVLDHSASAAINASVAQAKSPLRPDATLQITASGAGVELTTAQLFRADVQTYTINVASAQSTDGIALQRPVSFKVAVPARPHFVDVPTEPVTLRYGDTFTLKSDRELASAQVSTTSDVPTQVDVGRDQIRLALPDYQQGAEFDLDIATAVSAQGAPLAQPLQIHFVTPPALDPPTFEPEDGSVGIQPSSRPSVTFAAPV